MPILPRYFMRLFLPVFGLCLSIFAAVLLMNHFLRLFNMAVIKGISPIWIATCFARLLPFIASLAVPMAFVVALLLVFGQLSEGNEIMALRASGFSFLEISWPFLAVAVSLAGLLLFLNHKTSPEGFHSFRNQYAAASEQIARVDLEPRSFVSLGAWKLFAREVDKDSGRLGGVYLVRQQEKQRGIRVDAARGQLTIEKGKDVSLELDDGEIQLPNVNPRILTAGRFKRYRVSIPLSGAHFDRPPDIQEINSSKLKLLIRDPGTSQQHRVEYAVELAVRSAGALSPFVFFWIAVPLSLSAGRYSRGQGFAMSLLILFFFYGLLAWGIGFGRRHENLASVAPWTADAIGLLLGAYLTRRTATQ
ncbi:MAG: LptF/LptG family permease [Elusimicrobia bacterium]|nr:LptF/LptG family permease [Elusimicrobiota bacterium]